MTVSAGYVTKPEARSARQTRISGSLDPLDIRLLRELLQGGASFPLDPDFRKSFRKIATALKIDEDTLRNRVRRLEQIGFLGDYHILVNPHVLGLSESIVWLDVPSLIPKTDLIEKLKLLPGVFIIINHYGASLAIFFSYDTTQSMTKTVSLIQKLSNAPTVTLAHLPWPETRMKLVKTDWMILDSLRRNPRKSSVAISRELRISTRTVQRRLEKMTKEGVMFAMPAVSPKALNGTILADLAIEYSQKDTSGVARRIAAELDDYLWHVTPTMPPPGSDVQYCWFELALPNVSKVREVLEWTKKQSGIRNARIEMQEDEAMIFETIESALEKRLVSLDE